MRKVVIAKDSPNWDKLVPKGTTVRQASYEHQTFIPEGGTLYLWTSTKSTADIKVPLSLPEARKIAKQYGIAKLHVQSR
jgi:hypothetical protein